MATNAFAKFIAGRQAAQGERDSARQNALGDLQLQRAERLNSLGPQASAEDYIRAGDSQTGNALTANDENRQHAAEVMGTIAQRAAQIPDPAGRRNFLQQAAANPALAGIFQANGVDPREAQANLAQLDDQKLDAWIQQHAALGPQGKAPEGFSLSAGQSRFDAQGRPIAALPANEPNAPSSFEEYQRAAKDPAYARFLKQRQDAAAANQKPPAGYEYAPDGSLRFIKGGPADPTAQRKPPGESDKKNAVLFASMMNAEEQIKGLEKTPNATDTSSVGNAALGKVGLGYFQSNDFRKYEAAGLRWAANLLYLKSGATATPEEVKSTWKQFFPQPGDGPDVKAQKESARQQEIAAVRQNMVTPFQGSDQPPPAGATGPIRVNTPEEAMKLPPGTVFITPDGRQKVR